LLSPKCEQQDIRTQPPSSSSLNSGVVECKKEGRKLIIMVLTINTQTTSMEWPTLDLVVVKIPPSSPSFNVVLLNVGGREKNGQ
jgi:hypothetical protein